MKQKLESAAAEDNNVYTNPLLLLLYNVLNTINNENTVARCLIISTAFEVCCISRNVTSSFQINKSVQHKMH